MIFQLFNADYKKIVKKLKKEKCNVDAIITDPPYNVSRSHQLGYSNMGRTGMNYGDWDYNFDQKSWIIEVADLIKPGGTIIIFNDWKNLGDISTQLSKCEFNVKDVIRWVKKNPMPRNSERRYVNDCEYAIWAVKSGASWTFNKPKDLGYLKPCYETSTVPGGKNRLHPTQKHIDLITKLVEIHTNVGDLVFDPFLGSGTTAVACLNRGRRIIGTEINKKYYESALKRIQND